MKAAEAAPGSEVAGGASTRRAPSPAAPRATVCEFRAYLAPARVAVETVHKAWIAALARPSELYSCATSCSGSRAELSSQFDAVG